MTHVVFDIGGVLVHGDPALIWSDELGPEGAEAFLARIGFDGLELACDGGAPLSDAVASVADAEDGRRLSAYNACFAKSIPHKIEGSWEHLYALKRAGHPVSAITNWPAETWPIACDTYPELASVFDTTIVSAAVGMVKPGLEIYRHFCAVADVAAQDCLFIDDRAQNCVGAIAAGMDALHFSGPDALADGLQTRGLI